MAKEILGSKISSAGALPEGASMDFDPGFIEGILRSVLVEGTAYAQPLAPFCVSFIENALMSINSRKKGPEEAGAAAFLLLTSLDALVCTTAKLKATVSAAHPSARASDISALVKQDALSGRLDTIPDDIATLLILEEVFDLPPHYNKASMGIPESYACALGICNLRPCVLIALRSRTYHRLWRKLQAMLKARAHIDAFSCHSYDAVVKYTRAQQGQGAAEDKAAQISVERKPSTVLNTCIFSASVRTAALVISSVSSTTGKSPSTSAFVCGLWWWCDPGRTCGSVFAWWSGSACIVQGQPILGSACMHGIQETIFISVHPVRNTEGQTGQASGIAQGSPSTQQGSTGTHYDLETPGTSQTGAGTLPHASVDVTPKSVFALRFGKGGMEYVDSGKVNLAQVTVPGLSGTTVPLTSLPVFQDKDQQPKYGVHFHDIQTDYILGNRGTKNDICITDAMVLPTGGDSYTPGEGPPQSLAALAASAVERWSLRKMHEATHGTVTLFRDNNTIEQHVQRLLTKHHANIADATTPAPSFNTLTSSGCKSYSDEARRLFYEYYASAQLFWSVKGNERAHGKLRFRAQLLQAKAVKYGFLDVCGKDCYNKPKSKRGDVMASSIYSMDYTLTKLNSMAFRGLTLGAAFFGGLQCTTLSQNEKYRVAHLSVLNSWMDKGKKVKELSAGITSEIETYALGLERYVNILLEHSETQGLFSLAAHSWVQMRGIYNAAEGYLPGKGDTISKRNKQLAAIFAKLWYEMDLGIRQPAHSVLKPFPAMLASVTLQVAKGLTHVAAGIITNSCKDLKKIDMGRVKATVEASGKRQNAGNTILKHRNVSLRRSELEHHLNILLSTYVDPLDLIRTAQDLATRCSAQSSALASDEPPPQEETKEKRKLPQFKKPPKGNPDDERVVQMLTSKFVLDSWCLKYRDYVMRELASVPKTTDSNKLVLFLDGVLDKTSEIVLVPGSVKTSWVINLKCPFMRDFVDPQLRQSARHEMLQYALSRMSAFQRVAGKLRAIKNWFSKKFTWRRKNRPGLVANNEWAVIHAGTGLWDPVRQRFEHTLTFRPEEMSCGNTPGHKNPIDFQHGQFIFGSSSPAAEANAILCYNENRQCWATPRALMFKGSTEPPVQRFEAPSGPWYSRLPDAVQQQSGASATSAEHKSLTVFMVT
ncbi:uncharacterized protein LOC34621714 [Cyclospora cayetanensis]|uniref:Uncharacterized protein LOC34621714 n=1 Tax=Cyclospora cayetanensis TaxID=88456 RepID=A0A6P6S3M0_9EIME|nr:uncharacterized protein LOC34621714 [Cyclospora cayetanensis]